jgi:hypothetical protein
MFIVDRLENAGGKVTSVFRLKVEGFRGAIHIFFSKKWLHLPGFTYI